LPRWQARSDNAFVSAGLMGSTRLGARIADLPDGTTFGGGQGIIKTGSSTNTALGASFSVTVVSFGAAESDGTSGSDIDFLDFNGDACPDGVAGASRQAPRPTGAPEGRRIVPNGQSQVRRSTNTSLNENLGATISGLRAGGDNFPLNIFSEQASYNIGVGVNA